MFWISAFMFAFNFLAIEAQVQYCNLAWGMHLIWLKYCPFLDCWLGESFPGWTTAHKLYGMAWSCLVDWWSYFDGYDLRWSASFSFSLSIYRLVVRCLKLWLVRILSFWMSFGPSWWMIWSRGTAFRFISNNFSFRSGISLAKISSAHFIFSYYMSFCCNWQST